MSETRGTIVSCPAPLGQGGLGKHLQQVVESLRSSNELHAYFATSVPTGDSAGRAIALHGLSKAIRWTPIRFLRRWHMYLGSAAFDVAVASRLPEATTVIAFAGAALYTFREARRRGFRQLQLESAGTHVIHARAMYDVAYRKHPLEQDWLHPRLAARAMLEYEMADVIWVNSEFARQTFVEAGIAPTKLHRRTLHVESRFVRRSNDPDVRQPTVIYVGSLSVTKGTPILVDLFSRFPNPQARLILIGGYGSSGMRRFLHRAIARDPRISLQPGDPLPHLNKAHVFVYPSYADGLGLAPLEAIAVGVPVIVSDCSGAKEYIVDRERGFVVPVQDVDLLYQRLVELVPSLSEI